MKELKIEAPKGYEIDKENSTLECIKFKKKEFGIRTWNDYVKKYGNLEWLSFKEEKINLSAPDSSGPLPAFATYFNVSFRKSDFTDNYHRIKKHIKAFLIINKLMPYYGGAVTANSWNDACVNKFTIKRIGGLVKFGVTMTEYSFLAFYSYENRDKFYDNNEQLVKDYLMIE